MMRIGFVGSHGTGKSTLVAELLKKLPAYSTQKEECSRIIKAKGLGLNFETNLETQQAFFEQFKLILEIKEKNFITPRTLIDLWAYNLYFLKRQKYGLNLEFVDEVKEYTLKNLAWWDFFIYVPIEFEIEKEDEYRIGQKGDSQYRHEVDNNISSILRQEDIKFFTVTGNVEHRIKQILTIIRVADSCEKIFERPF